MSMKNSKQIEKVCKLKLRLKQIAITPENYDQLKQLGHAGDSFNDVITELLEKKERCNLG